MLWLRIIRSLWVHYVVLCLKTLALNTCYINDASLGNPFGLPCFHSCSPISFPFNFSSSRKIQTVFPPDLRFPPKIKPNATRNLRSAISHQPSGEALQTGSLAFPIVTSRLHIAECSKQCCEQLKVVIAPQFIFSCLFYLEHNTWDEKFMFFFLELTPTESLLWRNWIAHTTVSHQSPSKSVRC